MALGLQHTAGIITAAGLILVATFGSIAASNLETMKEIGVGLAIGVLIDATLVRIIMVPATMRLAQKVNWWIPGGWIDCCPPSSTNRLPRLRQRKLMANVGRPRGRHGVTNRALSASARRTNVRRAFFFRGSHRLANPTGGSVFNVGKELIHPGTTEHGVTARHAVRAATEPDEKIHAR